MSDLDFLNRTIEKGYEDIWNNLVGVVDDKNSIIGTTNKVVSHFKLAMDHYVAISNENGFVIDPTDPENIVVYIDSIHTIEDGDEGFVFRADDQYVAKIIFHVGPQSILAKAAEVTEGMSIDPFDKILIQVR